MNVGALLLVVLVIVIVADFALWVHNTGSWLAGFAAVGSIWLATVLFRWARP